MSFVITFQTIHTGKCTEIIVLILTELKSYMEEFFQGMFLFISGGNSGHLMESVTFW